MEEYYQTVIDELRTRIKIKDNIIKQLEERLDKNQIIKELEREKAKNKKLEKQLKVEKENVETFKKKSLLYSVMNLKEEK